MDGTELRTTWPSARLNCDKEEEELAKGKPTSAIFLDRRPGVYRERERWDAREEEMGYDLNGRAWS